MQLAPEANDCDGRRAITIVWLDRRGIVARPEWVGSRSRRWREDVFKNVQVLKGIPVNEFMGTMGIFSAALGMSCEDCHAASDRGWEVYAADAIRESGQRAEWS